ncbi:hypothetical protein FOMPIDRAFT_1016395 [Fomitopsis schrenkii]|uniref:NACHT domain-containing protein n=1 Tax=Fomitopsis schrenkii TaxID=2126942 RepID=S8FGJ6_FOMSC|nr:hypothetical protein FOMPIDRAFT_1016395 [Fomitopsis schrenkii]
MNPAAMMMNGGDGMGGMNSMDNGWHVWYQFAALMGGASSLTNSSTMARNFHAGSPQPTSPALNVSSASLFTMNQINLCPAPRYAAAPLGRIFATSEPDEDPDSQDMELRETDNQECGWWMILLSSGFPVDSLRIRLQLVSISTCTDNASVLRKDRLKRKSGGPAVILSSIFGSEGQFEPKMNISNEYGMSVTVELGSVVTATEVADARLKEAMHALDSKQGMMDILEIGTKQLALLSQVGEALSERVTDIPTSHGKLVKLASELVEQLESSRMANEVFSSEHVQKALEKLISLMIRTAEEIKNCYSTRKWIVFVKELASPRRESVIELETELEQHKGAISQAFLVEVRGGITEVQNGVDDVKEGVSTVRLEVAAIHQDVQVLGHNDDEEKNERLLAKLLPPDDSRFYGKVACIEGTRMSVLDSIRSWFCGAPPPQDTESLATRSMSSRLFWLHGVAGCGKSTIAASVCHMLAGQLAGSFFCKRDQDSRRNGVRLFWAIAFYLARVNVTFREQLLKQLREVDTLIDVDLDTQVNRLLIQPLKGVVHNETSDSALVVIDALDECSNSENVARTLARIVESTPWVRFVVTSRDLPEIRVALTPLGELKERHDLFLYDARNDIHSYLRSQFDGPLAELHPYLDDGDVASLVDRSQGLFIWAHTVIQVLVETRIGKLDVLGNILNMQGAAESESALDSIYRVVLENAAGSSTTSRDIVRLVIGLILVTSANEPLPSSALHAFLPAHVSALRTEFDTILQLLSPVLIINGSSVRVYHTSFLDFSSDVTRCGEAFYTSQQDLNTIMATGCLEIMESGARTRKRCLPADKGERTGLKFNICRLRTSFLPNTEVEDLEKRKKAYISPELFYSSMFWVEHIVQSGILASSEAAAEHQGKITDLLCTERALFWLEVMSITGKLAIARSVLVRIILGALPQIETATLGMAAELRGFLDQFHSVIELSTPHLYLSTLPWLSTTLKIRAAWEPKFPLGQILRDPIRQRPFVLHHVKCPDAVRTVSISRDGSFFTACGKGGVVRIFSMHTGRIVWEQPPTPSNRHSAVKVAAFSPVADILVSSHDGSSTICVWGTDGHDWSLKCTVKNTSKVVHLCFSRDGLRLATGSVDSLVRIWDVESWELKYSLITGDTDEITFVTFSPDGERLAAASENGTIRLWDTKTASLIGAPMTGHGRGVRSLAFSPDGATLASSSRERRVIIWNGRTGAMQRDIFGEWGPSLAFTNDGRFMLFVCEGVIGGMRVCVWDTRTDESFERQLSDDASCGYPRIALSPDGTRGVVAFGAPNVKLLDIPAVMTKSALEALPGHSECVVSVAFCLGDTLIASGGKDDPVYLWSQAYGECLNAESPMQHDSMIEFVQSSPDGKLLASGHCHRRTCIWDVEDGTLVCEFRSDGWVKSAAWSPDGKKLAVAATDYPGELPSLRFWDPRTGQPLGEPCQGLKSTIHMVVYSPDGRSLACVCENNKVRLWDAETCMQIGKPFTGHSEYVMSIAFSPDGSKLVTGGQDQSLRVWDATTGEQLFDPVMHVCCVMSVAFSVDGKLVYSAGEDRCIHAWDSETGRRMGRPLRGHTDFIYSIAVSHDGRHIVSGGDDKAIRLWDSQAFFWEKAPWRYDLDCGLRGPERVPRSIPEDGWIRTSQGELVLWVPTEYRGRLCEVNSLCISKREEDHPVRVRWDDLCGGDSWDRVHSSLV